MFKRGNSYDNHMKMLQSKNVPCNSLTCNVCGVSLTHKESLSKHLKRYIAITNVSKPVAPNPKDDDGGGSSQATQEI